MSACKYLNQSVRIIGEQNGKLLLLLLSLLLLLLLLTNIYTGRIPQL